MLRSLSIVQVFQVVIFHCFLLGLEKYSYAAENKQNPDFMTEPVLGLDLDARILPLYRRILMDPNRKGLVPPDEAGLARLEQALAKDRQNLAEAKPERQAFLRSRLFERLVLKALYWQSVTVGELVNSADSITSNRNLLETHQEIFVLGPQIIKDTSNTKDRASILLQVLLAQAQYDDKRGSAMKNLEKIKSQFTHPKHLELIDFLLALEALETADLGLKKLAVKQLEVLANRMDRRYSSLASLAIARSLAGFASNGRPSWEASPDFASYTRYVSRLCQKLSLAEKNSIFDFSLSIWALQSKFDNQWDPVPFNLGCYEEAQQFPAFLERLAMASARRKQVDRALALYKHLDSKLKIPVQKQQINLRMAYLMRDDIKNGQYRDDYQDFLIASQASFRGTNHGIRLAQLHDEFMDAVLTKGLVRDPKVQILVGLRPLYQKYMDSGSENPNARVIRGKWAEVLAIHGLTQEAVSTFVSLAQGSSGSIRSRYLSRALSLQVQTVSWNQSDPWANPSGKDQGGLGNLRQIFSLLSEQTTGAEQALQKLNVAVIDRHLAQHEAARQELREILPQLSDRALRAETFTVLLAYALSTKDYPDLEELSLLGRKNAWQAIRPLESFRSLDELYQYSLEKQADALLASGQADEANQKLLSLIKELKVSERRNRARYLLARSYQNAQKFSLVKDQLMAIEKDGIHDDYYKQALLDRGALFLAQGDLPASVQSYSLFLKIFPNDSRRKSAQFVIVDGLLAQQKYDEARVLVNKLLASKELEDAELNSLAGKLMRIHQATLNKVWIREDIAVLERILPDKPELRARLAGLGYRENQNGDGQLRDSISLKLRDQSSSLFVVSDLMSQIAFEKARKEAEQGFSAVQRVLMNNQDNVFQKIQENYTHIRSAYAEACRVAYASHCGPALYETLFQAQRFKGLLQDMNLEQQSADSKLAQRNLDRYLSEEAETLGKRLADAVQHGNTLPDWIIKLSFGNEAFWRYSAATAARQVNYLALPTEMKASSSFSFAKGSAE